MSTTKIEEVKLDYLRRGSSVRVLWVEGPKELRFVIFIMNKTKN